MPLSVPNQAEVNTLQALVTAWGSLSCRLFKNNLTIDANTVVGDFTIADYSGYSNQAFTLGTPATDGDGKAYSLSGDISFPLAGSGTQTVYGWYALNNTGGLIFAKKFDAAVTVSTTVKVDTFTIKYTLREDS